jgi:hypothetical protein
VSEKITHTIVMDDSFRLMIAAQRLCPALLESAETCWDLARLGSGTRAADRHSVRLLTRIRDRWQSREPEDHLEAKLAFVMGWLCHRAADRQMKPIFRSLNPGSKESPTECSVYHDAFLFRERYLHDAEHLYTRATFETDLASLPAAGAVDIGAVRELFHTLMQQALIEIHTFDPDEEHIEAWIDGLSGLQQRFYVDVDRYARAVAAPDPEKVQRYIVDVDFYDRGEPIISAAHVLQRGEALAAEDVREAIDQDTHSHYAHALFIACHYLAAASRFFEHEIDAEELGTLLDIGRTGRDGNPV